MGLASAALFGLNAVFVKIGMRRRSVDNGHFMSILVNVLLLGTAMLWTNLPKWSWIGFIAFVLAGLMTSWLGRGTSFMAIRLLGPARQGAILMSAPLFAAIIGWLFLGEAITLLQATGGTIISVGILILLRSRMNQRNDPQEVVVGEMGQSAAVELPGGRSVRLRTAIRHDDFTRGFVVATISAFFFGAGFVARKWGFSHFPSAVGGAFLGTCTALPMILLRTTVQRDLRRLLDDNFREIPWWFVAAGTASSLALFLQFSAFDYLPAWIVSLLLGTQAVWTMAWTSIFLRTDERISRELIFSVGCVVFGVGIMTYGL